MNASGVQRAVAAAKSIATDLGLEVDNAVVLHDSNRLVLRLMPCSVVARVAPMVHQAGSAELEIAVVGRLAATDCPVAALEPRVPARAYVRDGFVVTLWTYYEPVPSGEIAPREYAHALERLHEGMRAIDLTAPHVTDRVEEAQRLVDDRDVTPGLADADRQLLANTLRDLGRSIVARGATEQLLHGEPHPWNLLSTKDGPLFIDFENSTRGPVEYDLAWVPDDVSKRYLDADQELVGECRGLMLAIVAAWRWHRDDQHPSGPRRAEWLSAFLQGPPWPALDEVDP
jgi:aminoglycoside phosphotransferase (APT) family kinase protein